MDPNSIYADDISANYRPLRENPVTMNDRSFSCGAKSCGGQSIEYSGMYTGLWDLDKSLSIHLKGTPIDVAVVRANLHDQMRSVKKAMKLYYDLLDQRGAQVVTYYDIGKITPSKELLGKINFAKSRISSAKKLTDAWSGEYQSLVLEANEALAGYQAALNNIRVLANTPETSTTIKDSVVLASKNETKQRSITKLFKKFISFQNELDSIIPEIEMMVNSFKEGLIMSNGKMLDLKELVEVIDSLTDRGTPLDQLAKRLAEIFNIRDIEINLGRSSDVNMTVDVEKESFLETMPAQIETLETKLDNLYTLNTVVLYTENTKSRIEEYFQTVLSDLDPSDVPQVTRIIDSIRDRTPEAIYSQLASEATEPGKIMVTIYKLEKIIDNINHRDIHWKRRFFELKRSLNEKLPQFVRDDATYIVNEPVNVGNVPVPMPRKPQQPSGRQFMDMEVDDPLNIESQA